MKKIALAVALLAAGFAQAETQVGVSIGINQPGVYGRIDIGRYPQPMLVYPQPMIIAPSPVAVYQRPVYLYVPPGHQKNWSRYCGQYRACGQPVYFVREDWVRDRYAEESRHGHGHDNGQKDSHGNKGGKHDHD